MPQFILSLIGLLPICAGILLYTLGDLIANNFEALVFLFTHKQFPEEMKTHPGIVKVNSSLKRIGQMLQVIGMGLVIYGLVILVVGLIAAFG